MATVNHLPHFLIADKMVPVSFYTRAYAKCKCMLQSAVKEYNRLRHLQSAGKQQDASPGIPHAVTPSLQAAPGLRHWCCWWRLAHSIGMSTGCPRLALALTVTTCATGRCSSLGRRYRSQCLHRSACACQLPSRYLLRGSPCAHGRFSPITHAMLHVAWLLTVFAYLKIHC